MSDKKVYEAIAAVTLKLSKEGISKDRKNDQQGYKFRGIDDVYNALAPFLAEAKLCILPNVMERALIERQSQKGGALFYVTVKVDFAFVAAEDGSEHHVITYGEAMDSGDKATNKAMSAAYKYACMQAFCIPTEGDNDADGKTHEVAPSAAITPNAGAGDEMTAKEKSVVLDHAAVIKDFIKTGNDWGAYEYIEERDFNTEQKLFLWAQLSSSERSAIKRVGAADRTRLAKETKAAVPA